MEIDFAIRNINPTTEDAIWQNIGVARGSCLPPKFLENIAILCFEKRFSNNSVIRLKSNILAPTNFWAGYATVAKSISIK